MQNKTFNEGWEKLKQQFNCVSTRGRKSAVEPKKAVFIINMNFFG